jgi:hypothetical protein
MTLSVFLLNAMPLFVILDAAKKWYQSIAVVKNAVAQCREGGNPD